MFYVLITLYCLHTVIWNLILFTITNKSCCSTLHSVCTYAYSVSITSWCGSGINNMGSSLANLLKPPGFWCAPVLQRTNDRKLRGHQGDETPPQRTKQQPNDVCSTNEWRRVERRSTSRPSPCGSNLRGNLRSYSHTEDDGLLAIYYYRYRPVRRPIRIKVLTWTFTLRLSQ